MNRAIKSAALLALLLLGGVASAQTKKETKPADKKEAKPADKSASKEGGVRVHIEKQSGGSTQIIDRYFSDSKAADAFVDSINTADGGRPQRMRIEINGDGLMNRNDNFQFHFDGPNGIARVRPGAPTPPRAPKAPIAPRIYRDGDQHVELDMRDFERSMQQFGRDMERYGKEMERWGEQFGDRFEREMPRIQQRAQRSQEQAQRMLRDQQQRFNFNFDNLPGVRIWENSASGSSSSTVKNLSVYPNQPYNNRLNVRFNAPGTGDVTILVTDVKGREVGRETLKNFSGNYVGQIDLTRKADKGTYFVTVSQGEDGAVKRIVVE